MSREYTTFEWDDVDTVVEPQNEIAVYHNHRGHVVIRQREDDGDDQMVIVQPHFLPALIAALNTIRDSQAEQDG